MSSDHRNIIPRFCGSVLYLLAFLLWFVDQVLCHQDDSSVSAGPTTDSDADQEGAVPPPNPTTNNNNGSDVSKPRLSSSKSLLSAVDKGMLIRMTYVLVALTLLIGLYFGIKMCRMRKRDRIRRYDVLSAKQLQPELVVDSEDSEDEIFADDSQSARLVKQEAGEK